MDPTEKVWGGGAFESKPGALREIDKPGLVNDTVYVVTDDRYARPGQGPVKQVFQSQGAAFAWIVVNKHKDPSARYVATGWWAQP